jgi:4-amino-4-deoxy-L-arabinose transferase-like glycosyltransferase
VRRIYFRNTDRVLAVVLALGAFLLYLRTLAPGVLDGDSGEWQYMANILGIPHSTGYPIYLLLAKLFTLLPFGNAAWRVNLFSSVCAALCVGITYLIARRVSNSRPGALAAASLFALAPTLWASAVEAEVYALNTLLVAATLYFALRWYQSRQPRELYLMAFAFGLALDNHRVSLFIAPGLLLLVWFQRRSLNRRRVALATALLLLPLLLYLYIPLRASQLLSVQTAANWELYPRAEAFLRGTISAYYNHTPYGVLNFITAFDNRNKLGFQDTSSNGLTARLANSVTLLFQQFNPLVILLTLAGINVVYRRDRRLTLFLLGGASGIAAIGLALHAESTRFYFSGAYLVLALFFAAACGELLGRFERQPFPRVVVLGLIALLPIITLWSNFASMDESGFNEYDTFARSLLQDNLAPDAVVIAPWEIATGLRYLQFVEGQRPDLLIIHESPVRPQFQKILASAHALKRAFYYVQFTPEDRNAAGPRTLQAVGLPLLTKPAPSYQIEAQLTDGLRVLGYDLKPDPALPGRSMRLMVYYQVVAPITTQFNAELDLTDIRGEPHGDVQHPPVSEYYPTYFWKAGDYYRDVWDIPLPPDAPPGLYNFQLAWYPFDPATNATHYEDAHILAFGPVRAGNFAAGDMPHLLRAEFSNGMTLLAYGLQTPNSEGASTNAASAGLFLLRRGQPVKVSLFWSASRQIQTAYTVFVHLQDGEGVLRAQSDRPPWDGMYPTDRWTVGEVVRDDYVMQLPNDLPAGDYTIRVGLYHTPDQRVALIAGGDELSLDSTIRLTEQ